MDRALGIPASLRQRRDAHFRKGAELVTVEVGPQSHPWRPFAGMFKDDPLIKEWRNSITEYPTALEDDQQAV